MIGELYGICEDANDAFFFTQPRIALAIEILKRRINRGIYSRH